MSKVDITYNELSDPLTYKLTGHRLDSEVSDDDLHRLCNMLVAKIIELRDKPRNFTYQATASGGLDNFSTPNSAPPANTQAINVSSTPTGTDPENSATEARREGVLSILGAATKAVSIGEVMDGLNARGLADEKQRSTVISMLRRLRINAKLINSPYDGYYELTDKGRNAYAQLTQTLARPSVK